MNRLIEIIEKKVKRNPPGFFVLFYTEMWELFGRFGVTAILVLYLTHILHFSDARSFMLYSTFIALVFVTPMIGGILADKYLGYRHAIIFGGITMVIGNIMLVFPHPTMVYFGLAIVALGSGFFTPSITPLVGFLYERDERGRDAGFTLYYLARNIGALIAPILCGIVGAVYGYNYAFILSAVGMSSGVIVFVTGQRQLEAVYRQNPQAVHGRRERLGFNPTGAIYILFIALIPIVHEVFFYNIIGYLLAISGILYLTIIFSIAIRRPKHEQRHILGIMLLMIFVIVFSAFLGQGGTTLNLFIDRITDRQLFGITIPTPLFYSLDPIFMMLFGPFLAALWLKLAKRDREPKVTTKMALALFLFAIGFLVFAFAGYRATLNGQTSMFYVVLAYAIFPLAELCIMPIGLSMLTRLAPKDLQAMMVGVWMLSNAIAGYLTGVISSFGKVSFGVIHLKVLEHAAYVYHNLFLATAGILVGAGVVILLLGPLMRWLMRPPYEQLPRPRDSELSPIM